MNTSDVVKKRKNMCEQGKNLECINELYAENVVSREMHRMPREIITCRQNVWNKSKELLDSVKDFHASNISKPVIVGHFSTSKMGFDCTFKARGRQKMEEVCVYEVKNGKIASEQYFYAME